MPIPNPFNPTLELTDLPSRYVERAQLYNKKIRQWSIATYICMIIDVGFTTVLGFNKDGGIIIIGILTFLIACAKLSTVLFQNNLSHAKVKYNKFEQIDEDQREIKRSEQGSQTEFLGIEKGTQIQFSDDLDGPISISDNSNEFESAIGIS